MPFYSVQVTIPTADNNVANFATNSFHFEADDLVALGLAFDALVTFYNTMRPRMNVLCRQNGWLIKGYDTTDPKPRAPVLERTFNLTSAPAGNATPPEVTICMSFQGARESGVPQSRKRGRIYFPFVLGGDVGSDGRPVALLVTTLAGAGDALLTASNAAATWSWLVYSVVTPGFVLITNGWVDNEFDTQRRRGRLATSRTTFD